MTFPQIYLGICKECNKNFMFTKENGIYKEVGD